MSQRREKTKIFIYNFCIFEGRQQSHRLLLDTVEFVMAKWSPSLLKAL